MDTIQLLEAEEGRLSAEREFLLAQIALVTRQLDATRSAIGSARQHPKETALPLPIVKQAHRLLAKIARKKVNGARANELVLDILKQSFPEALKAADIRRTAIGQLGVELNQNTLTTSLTRYRSQGIVTLSHRMWRYRPPSRESGWE